MTAPANLRTAMPTVTAWIDSLRDAFGADGINAQIRAAVRDGRPTFHARENGHEVGVAPRAPDPAKVVSSNDLVIGSNAALKPKGAGR